MFLLVPAYACLQPRPRSNGFSISSFGRNGNASLHPTLSDSGALLQRADATARWYRWLFNGFHRIDFTAWMRARPTWDIIVLTLMLGGLASTVTGFYLAIRRIRHDVVLLFRFITRRKVAVAQKGNAVGIG